MGTDRHSPLRLVSIALTSVLALALMFAVIYIQVRENGLIHLRLLNYGELERVQHKLRDWADILQTRTQTKPVSKRTILHPFPIEDDFGAAPSRNPQSWCRVMAGSGGKDTGKKEGTLSLLQLSVDSRQARDNRIMLSARHDSKARGCSRVNVVPLIGGVGTATRVDDLAIIDAEGNAALQLRGDAPWPRHLSTIMTSSQAGEKATKKTSNGLSEADDPTRKPVRVSLGGEDFDLYAVPLDLGRTVRIVGSRGGGGVDCPPRACLIAALGSRETLSESYYNLSALGRTLLLALVMLLVALVPMVKLLSIDQNGSLHWVEVAALVVSIPFAAAIGLGAVLAIVGWNEERTQADERILAVAADLGKEADARIGAMLSAMSKLKPGQCKPEEASARLSYPMAAWSKRSLSTSETQWFCNLPDEDSVGKIADREYFRRTQSLDGLRAIGDDPNWVYTVAQLPKLTTGEARLVVTARARFCPTQTEPATGESSALSCAELGDESFVMGAAVVPPEFKRPLPPGFDYAIIDAATFEVLEHSQPDHDFSLHFDRQLIDAGQLEATRNALKRNCDKDDATKPDTAIRSLLYEGEMRRMAFTYACKPGWIVASWYSRSTVQTMVTLPLKLAVSLFIVLLGVALCVALVTGAYRRELLIKAVWPRTNSLLPWAMAENGEEERVDVSREVALGLAVLALPATLLPLWFSGDAQLLAAFAVPIVGTIAFLNAFFRSAKFRVTPAVAIATVAVFVVTLVLRDRNLATFIGGDPWRSWAWLAWLATCSLGAWNCRALGRHAERVLKRVGAIGPRMGRSIVTVSDKSHSSRWLQAWMILFLVFAPMTLAFNAARSEMERRAWQSWTVANQRATLAANDMLATALLPRSDPSSKKGPSDNAQGGSRPVRKVMWYPDWLRCTPSVAEQAPISQTLLSSVLHRIGGMPLEVPISDATLSEPSCQVPKSDSAVFARWIVYGVTGGLIVLLVGFVAMLFRALNRGLFGLHHFEFRSLHSAGDIGKLVEELDKRRLKRILFVDFPWTKFDDLKERLNEANRYELLHLGQFRYEGIDQPDILSVKRPWIVMGFESIITNSELRQRALLLMEQLAAQPEARIYFFSEMLPIARLKHQRERELDERRKSGNAGRNYESEAYRWAELFERFVTFREEEDMAPSKEAVFWFGRNDPAPDGDEKADGEASILNGPLQAWRRRQPDVSRVIFEEMEALPSTLARSQIVTFATLPKNDANPPTREQINEYLANFLGDYYQSQWVRSSKEEHLVMYHLAHGRFVNANNFTVINNLLTRGLVRRRPEFRLMNESFAYWIRSLEHPRSFERFRDSVANGGAWTLLRVPVLLSAVALSIMVTYFERGMSGSLFTLVPAIAAAVPLVLSRLNDSKQAITS